MWKLIVAFLALLGGVSAVSAPLAPGEAPLAQSTKNDIDAGVRQMLAHIAADLTRGGPTAWIGYFDDDNGFLMAADGKLQFDGIAAAESFLTEFGKRITRVDLTWTDVRVQALDPNLATLAASYREALTDTQGHVVRPQGYFTGVAVRTADGWKLRTLHWSSPSPGP